MQKSNSKRTIIGGIMIFLFYLAWCVMTKSYSNSSVIIGAIICLLGGFLCYSYLHWELFTNIELASQLHGINIAVLTVFLLVFMRTVINGQLNRLELLITFIIVIITTLIEVIWIRRTGLEEYKKRAVNLLRKVLLQWEIMLVLTLFCILSKCSGVPLTEMRISYVRGGTGGNKIDVSKFRPRNAPSCIPSILYALPP